jgi:hypothetical protein
MIAVDDSDSDFIQYRPGVDKARAMSNRNFRNSVVNRVFLQTTLHELTHLYRVLLRGTAIPTS